MALSLYNFSQNWPAGVDKSYNLERSSFVSLSQLNSPDLLATTYPPSGPHLMKIPLTPTLPPAQCDWSLINKKCGIYVLSPIYIQRKMGFLIIQESLFSLKLWLKAVTFSNNDLEENITRHLDMIFSLSLRGKAQLLWEEFIDRHL